MSEKSDTKNWPTAAELIDLVVEQGCSVVDIAAEMESSRDTIYRWRRGDPIPVASYQSLCKIAGVRVSFKRPR